MTGGGGGMVDAGDPVTEIALLRANAQDGGMVAGSLSGAVVTYLKATIGADPGGFFVQAGPTGPAIFVAVDPMTLTPAPTVGDLVAFDATASSYSNQLPTVTAVANFQRLASGTPTTGLAQDLTAATNVSTGLDTLDSELITMRGVLDAGFAAAGTGFVSAHLATTASPADNVRFRVPLALNTSTLDLQQGCDVTVGPSPMWRFNTQAQPSAWVAGDVTIHSCPAPTVVSAAASSATSVTITFSRLINPASVLANGSQFTFDNGLTASAAVVSGKTVTVTTSAQSAVNYQVTVANSVTDTIAAPLGTPSTATFAGFVVRAVLRINEFNANLASGCDLIELRAVSGGSIQNFRLMERDTGVLLIFPAVTVAKNDLIVVHLNNTATCNPGTAVNETTSITQQPVATFARNYDTAWDFYSADTGLTSTDNVFTLFDPVDVMMDVVLAADAPTGLAAVGSETAAAAAAMAMQWQMVGGGIPVGGFIDDNFRAHAALDLNATGTTAAGDSIRRIDDTDDNDVADWAQGASTFGLINAGQMPFP
jgi:hypothetical protein